MKRVTALVGQVCMSGGSRVHWIYSARLRALQARPTGLERSVCCSPRGVSWAYTPGPSPGGQQGPALGPARAHGTNHLLRLAEVDVLLVPAVHLGVLDVYEADEGHGAAAQQQDGEQHDDDRGGANELPLLHGLQVQVQAQGVGDGAPQAWVDSEGSKRSYGRTGEAVASVTRFSGDLGTAWHHGQLNLLTDPTREYELFLWGPGIEKSRPRRGSPPLSLHRVAEQVK